jgi:alkyl hydroperoxide reductase subunit AhpF
MGFFYKGQRVVVVSGGNTPVEEALYLSNTASPVIVVHRHERFCGEKILANRPLIISLTLVSRLGCTQCVGSNTRVAARGRSAERMP